MGNKIPASWFDDDPEWEMLRRKAADQPVPKDLKQKITAQRSRTSPKRETPRLQTYNEKTDKELVVNLKLALPRIKTQNIRSLYRAHKQQLFVLGGVIVCVVASIGVFRVVTGVLGSPKSPTLVEDQSASFDPLVPIDRSASENGEPEYVFDNQRKVLGYSTEYNGAVITINQQALPEKFKTNPGELEYVAKSFQATEAIDTQKGKAFIATDPKNGSQRAVFAYKEVLVFVHANKKLDSEEWKYYINQLTPKG